MLERLINIKKIIPDEYQESIYDIDYQKLYDLGKRVVFFDLDNTIISYKEKEPNDKINNFFRNLEAMGYEVLIVSNARKSRIKHFSDLANLKYVYLSLKPTKFGFRRALKKCSRKYSKEEILQIGDQLMTDIYGSKRSGYYTILVKAIDHKTEHLLTRINRIRERNVLNKIKKKDFDAYLKYLSEYERDNL